MKTNVISSTLSAITVSLLMIATGAKAGMDVIGDRGNIGSNHTLSASWSTITGGSNNTATANYATVGGGNHNSVTAQHSFIGGGNGNLVTVTNAVIVGGRDSTNRSPHSFIGGGYENIISNDYGGNFIGAGFENLVLGSYSVLGGGAHNHIGNDMGYQGSLGDGNFIGTGNFITNKGAYSAIVSGYGNNIKGWGHFIGSGYWNSIDTSEFGNFDPSAIVSGKSNRLESAGIYSFIGSGYLNTNRAAYGMIGSGLRNLIDGDDISGIFATIGGGQDNFITGSYGTIPGGVGAYSSHHAQLAYSSGAFGVVGDSQSSLFVARRSTSNGTQTELFLDNAGERMTIPSGATWTFDSQVSARSSTGVSAGYHFSGVVKNVSGTTTLLGCNTLSSCTEASSAGWSVAIEGDNTNDALVIKVTGAASTNIRWVATVRTSEVTY